MCSRFAKLLAPNRAHCAVVWADPDIAQLIRSNTTANSRPANPPPELDVFGKVNVMRLVQLPSAVNVKSSWRKVVFPSVLNFAEVVVKVAVPHVTAGVNVAHAVPVSPVPPLVTANGATGREKNGAEPVCKITISKPAVA